MTGATTKLLPDDGPASIYGVDGQPHFFRDPAMDRFAAVLLNITSELWVQIERMANLEAILAEKSVVSAAELKEILARPVVNAERDKQAHAFVTRLLTPLREPE